MFQSLVKIGLLLAEIFHYTETGTNVAGTNVAGTNVAGTNVSGQMSQRHLPTCADGLRNQFSKFG